MSLQQKTQLEVDLHRGWDGAHEELSYTDHTETLDAKNYMYCNIL